MALFGGKENAEVVALQQQVAAAHSTIAELRGWVGQLRGAETGSMEAELRHLRSSVEQAKSDRTALVAPPGHRCISGAGRPSGARRLSSNARGRTLVPSRFRTDRCPTGPLGQEVSNPEAVAVAAATIHRRRI